VKTATQRFRKLRYPLGFLAFWAFPTFHIYSLYNLTSGNSEHGFVLCLLSSVTLAALLTWTIRVKRERYIMLKPLWERPLALLLLILFSPVLLITALLIRLESYGASVYRQRRIGMNMRKSGHPSVASDNSPFPTLGHERRAVDFGGRPFTIYKLRSMTIDAESQAGAAWSTGDHDPRITTIGYYIRKTHLDELPQLYNVLRGEMSLIGPRPERPDFIVRLTNLIEGYPDRLAVPPGITGLSQVRKEHDQSLEDVKEKLQHDREYIENACLLLDTKILFKTVILMINLFWGAIRRRTVEKIEPKTPDIFLADHPNPDR
jgi:lipopolysaccharide/colanic/teichoic acid biosynthesis glycosyltransferase